VSDIKERVFWSDYMTAYEHAIRQTASTDAPWYIVPADNKWFTRAAVAAAVVDTLASLDLSYPKVDKQRRKEIVEAKRALLRE
jgi:polyphosphate kinase 2 (PPK2 family)